MGDCDFSSKCIFIYYVNLIIQNKKLRSDNSEKEPCGFLYIPRALTHHNQQRNALFTNNWAFCVLFNLGYTINKFSKK